MSEAHEGRRERRASLMFSSERAKAFVDAVVAIAMTLLILPLTESVAGHDGELNTDDWLSDHSDQLINFVLSFVIIAMFWINHHRLFASVEKVTSGLLWLNIGWLLTIVWLPVATAIVGRAPHHDALAAIIYVGSMIVTSALLLGMRLFLRAHPDMHSAEEGGLRNGIAVDLAMITLFAISLVLILTVDWIGYWALLLMMLTGPLQALYARLLHANRADRVR